MSAYKSLKHPYFNEVSRVCDGQDSGSCSQDSGIGSQNISTMKQDAETLVKTDGKLKNENTNNKTNTKCWKLDNKKQKSPDFDCGVNPEGRTKRTYSEMAAESENCEFSPRRVPVPPYKRLENQEDEGFSGSDSGLSDISYITDTNECSNLSSGHSDSASSSQRSGRIPLSTLDIDEHLECSEYQNKENVPHVTSKHGAVP